MKILLLLFCICTLAIVSCGPSKKVFDAKEDALLNQWLKQPKSQLLKQWGLPDSVMSDGRNGEILIYKEDVSIASVMSNRYTGLQYSFRKEMYINPDSLIYHWRVWRRH